MFVEIMSSHLFISQQLNYPIILFYGIICAYKHYDIIRPLYGNCYNIELITVMASAFTVASQQDTGLNPQVGMFQVLGLVWSLHLFLTSVWVSSGCTQAL